MEPWQIPAVIVAGFACGFINVLAGSGSLITLPLLIFIGLPAGVANGTNRVAIMLQNLVAVRGFHGEGLLDLRAGLRLFIPVIAGGLLGARLAVSLDERMMKLAIAAVMLIMLVVLILKPGSWLAEQTKASAQGWWRWPVFFAVGIYGGFIQAGVGLFLLAALVLVAGHDLVRANALKVLLILGWTPLVLILFASYGQVDWVVGLTLALGNMLGAWVGTRTAIKKGAPFIHRILIGVVAVSALKLVSDAVF